MLLGDEEGVEVPEAGVDEAGDRSVSYLNIVTWRRRVLLASWHLYETLIEEDGPELLPDFHQGM
jgi:hypothetical protein